MKYFNLFSNIIITKGANRALFIDIQRNESELYPLEFCEIIVELKSKSIEDLLNDFDSESQAILQEYIDVLLEKEYGFITLNDWDQNFPPIPTNYEDASFISDIVVELDDISVLDKIKNSVEELCIKYLVIFCERHLSLNEFIEIDTLFYKSSFVGIEIYSPFYEEVNNEFVNEINEKTTRFYNLVFYSCPTNPFRIKKDEFKFSVHFVKNKISRNSCGKVSLDYFTANITKVLESLNHNSCLHKKIAIDKDGNIKNCPAMAECFGNIKDTTLEEAIQKTNFKKSWNITKDQIDTCKDCEFRHVCTDCRAFVEDPNNDFSKPLKCGYNPYTNEWEEWSKNPLKKKAIAFYQL